MKLCALLCFLLLSGNAAHTQSSYKTIEVKNGGTVTGVVRLVGKVPPLFQMEIAKDEKVCGRRKPSPRLAVGKNNGVQYAAVCLEGIKEGKSWEPLVQALGQHKCEYEPHVMLMQAGTPLTIHNDDPVLHNIHAYFGDEGGRTIWNIAQPIKGQRSTIPAKYFATPGRVVATCDAGHPWMSAYIIVMDHPYYAITDKNGRYSLRDIPPGTYTLTMWHEGVTPIETLVENGKPKSFRFEEPYESKREITITADARIAADFEFELRPLAGK